MFGFLGRIADLAGQSAICLAEEGKNLQALPQQVTSSPKEHDIVRVMKWYARAS